MEHCCVSTLLISNLFFASSKKDSRCCKAVCPRFNHWGLLICRFNIIFTWAFTNIFFSSPFFLSPYIFLTAVRINQPPLAVASPKVQEISLPTTSTFIDGSRMYWTILCLYPIFLIYSCYIIVCQLQVEFLLLTLLRSSLNNDLFWGYVSSHKFFY